MCREKRSVHIWVPFHDRVVQCVTNAWQILRSQVECDTEDVDGTECSTNHVYTTLVSAKGGYFIRPDFIIAWYVLPIYIAKKDINFTLFTPKLPPLGVGSHETYNLLCPYPTDATYHIWLRLAQ